MSNGHLEILKACRLGDSVAEEERDQLTSYFVQTEAWERLLAGEVDIIYGSKGAGKSALYLRLIQETENKKNGSNIHLLQGENVSEDPIFGVIRKEDNLSEDDFIGIWKLYILALMGNYVRENLTNLPDADQLLKPLQEAGLIPVDGLSRLLREARRYLGVVKPSVQIGEITYAITLAEPTAEQESRGIISASSLLKKFNAAFADVGIKFWILFDRLDVAFVDPAVETPALRALFRVYRDLSGSQSLRLKIFLRDDIWDRITRESGFREQSHITRYLNINWTTDALKFLVVSRFVNNPSIQQYLGVTREQVIGNERQQKFAFENIFPKQLDSGTKKPETFDWMVSRIQDGKSKYAPREIINLIKFAREEQVRIEEVGGSGSNQPDHLISSYALKAALVKVSEAKVMMLFSEYPDMRLYIEAFKNRKAEQSNESLAEVFAAAGFPKIDFSPVIKTLVDIGYLREKRNGQLAYWIPFLYRPFLNIAPGSEVAGHQDQQDE